MPLVPDCPIEDLFERETILGMHPFHEERIGGLRGLRIVVKNPKMFLRPVDQPRANMPTPTARMAYPFSLG